MEQAGTVIRKAGWVAPARLERPAKKRGQWADTVKKRPIDWLWKPFLQKRAINLITGDPKTGKSTMVCEVAAAFSTGRPLPGETESRPPMNVWLMNGEDYADDTIVWRLDNQQADLKRILVTDLGEQLSAKDVSEIEQEIIEKDIQVVFIDPLQNWLEQGLSMNQANETRPWFGLFRAVALKTGCTFIFVRHRRKGGPGESGALQSGLGSIDISGIARSELSTVKKDGKFVLYRLGGNVGQTGDGWEYNIKYEEEKNGDHGVLRWQGERKLSTEGGTSEPKKGKAAIIWLAKQLEDGPMWSEDVITDGVAAGFSASVLQRARKVIGDTKLEGGKHYWSLKAALLPEHQIVGEKT